MEKRINRIMVYTVICSVLAASVLLLPPHLFNSLAVAWQVLTSVGPFLLYGFLMRLDPLKPKPKDYEL